LNSTFRVRSEDLRDFSKAVLQKMDVPPADAEVVSAALVDADLRGLGTHGAVRLTLYSQLFRDGLVNPRPRVRLLSESSAHVLLDNDYGLGFLGGVKAMNLCVQMAAKTGVAMAGVRNSSHFGAAGYYALMAAERNLVGFAASNSYPVMAPPGANTPVHGNNPFAFAFPGGKRFPIVVDMATSVASQGKIKQYANEGKPIPLGWAYDREGRPTEDPRNFFLLAPFGEGGYKGYGLALAMDVLAGVLTGSFFAQGFVSGPGSRGCGHFFLAFDPQRFLPLDEYRQRTDEMIAQMKKASPGEGAQGEIHHPGERGFLRKNKWLREGIPMLSSTLQQLDRLAEEMNLPRVKRAVRPAGASVRH
jgi:LDH2 family malate/lactate/ureidoglycolate dehydrogenase